MSVRQPAMASNPLARAATSVPMPLALGLSVAARVAGAAAALWFAYDQYDAFDGRFFGRTWAYTIALAVLAVASCVPVGGRAAGFVPALGAGILLFAGAILARDGAVGVAVLVAGIVAWLATAAWNEHRGKPAFASVAGLFLGFAVAFAGVVIVALIADA